jgi:RNA polymerase sigma-70 factor (ECF subfamily)
VASGPNAESERELYARLVRNYAADLYRFGFRLCGDAHLAEDLVQETYGEAWRGRGRLRERSKARAWLFQILRYRYAHHMRARGRRPRVVGSDVGDGVGTDPNVTVGNRDELQRALDALDDRFKIPFLMVFVEGLSTKECAAALEIPTGTVLSRLHRARAALRTTLRPEANASAGGSGG